MSIDPQQAQLAFPVAAQVFGVLVTAHTKDGRERLTAYQAEKLAEKAIVASMGFSKKWMEYLAQGGNPPWMAAGPMSGMPNAS